MTANRSLTFATGPYDRMRSLFDGSVRIEGIHLQPRIIGRPVELFSRMLEHREFDIAEMSLTHCYALPTLGRDDFVSLPVFPSRMFRHGFIFINRQSGIVLPQDLAGKRIGVQGHQMTAAVWIRGLLRDTFDVDLSTVRWFEGGVNEPGVVGGGTMELRPRIPIDIHHIRPDTTLSDMLASGEIDALIGAFTPKSFGASPDVVRLLEEPASQERAYFAKTGIFPIMHALVVKREIFDSDLALAAKIMRACEASKQAALQSMAFSAALAVTLPWLLDHIEETKEIMGADPWPYGIEPNRLTLEAFGRILHEDGFTPTALTPEEVFAQA